MEDESIKDQGTNIAPKKKSKVRQLKEVKKIYGKIGLMKYFIFEVFIIF